MTPTKLTLLSSTQGKVNHTGDAVASTGTSSVSSCLYTVAIYPRNFQGRVYIEATLHTEPTEDDWFPVVLSGETLPYVEFPRVRYKPTKTLGFNFRGNFTWIRARQERDYLHIPQLITEQQLATYGSLDRVTIMMFKS